MRVNVRSDQWLVLIAMIVLASGTATGQAYVMLAASLIALLLALVPVYRQRRWSGPTIVALLASIVATLVGTAAAVAVAAAR
jgi:hypothetical protein